jgi:hypothetical protein
VQLELMADTHTTEIKVNPVYQKTPTSSEEEITAVIAAQRRWGFHIGSATKALVVMLGLLAAGTIAALGQDLFYSRVKGKPVDDVSISQGLGYSNRHHPWLHFSDCAGRGNRRGLPSSILVWYQEKAIVY